MLVTLNLIISNNEQLSIKLYDIEIQNSNYGKALGIKIDPKLNFKEYLDGIIKKANRKVSSLFHIAPYMNFA